MRLWHLKIKQYFPYKDLPFLLSVVLLFPSLSFHQKVTIQPPKEKRNSPGKNSCVEASFHFPASLLQPSRPAKHMMFLQIRCEKTEKDAFCHLSATGTASATLGLNSFISLFSYCSVEKAFSFSVQESVFLSTTSWMDFCNFNSFYSKISQQLGQKVKNSSFTVGSWPEAELDVQRAKTIFKLFKNLLPKWSAVSPPRVLEVNCLFKLGSNFFLL